MSDKNEIVDNGDDGDINTSPDLDFDGIVRYLEAHKISKSCTCCGHGLWDVVGSIKNSDSHLLPNIPINALQGVGTSDSGFVYPVLLTACDNCGFIRMFARTKIVNWIKDNPVVDGEFSKES